MFVSKQGRAVLLSAATYIWGVAWNVSQSSQPLQTGETPTRTNWPWIRNRRVQLTRTFPPCRCWNPWRTTCYLCHRGTASNVNRGQAVVRGWNFQVVSPTLQSALFHQCVRPAGWLRKASSAPVCAHVKQKKARLQKGVEEGKRAYFSNHLYVLFT